MTSAPLELLIDGIVDEISDNLIAIRRDLHRYPELGFEEVKTSRKICDYLEDNRIVYRSGFGKTGVAAVINPDETGRIIGVRGDIDALPILEKSGLSFASENSGVMHACGHDAHTAIALGVATVLSRLADHLPGRAMIVFQPAEEGLGGARAMLADGLFDWMRPDIMLGYHNWPLLPGGVIGWHPEVSFASSDPFDVVIEGISGHGAHPHLSVDPIVAAAQFILQAQTIVSREIAPLSAAVVTVGRIDGGSARNQIPDRVTLQGAIRTQSEDIRIATQDALKRIAKGIGDATRTKIHVDFLQGVGVVRSNPAILETVVDTARDILGDENVVCLPQGSMGSEDFAEFSALVPSAHLRIGSKATDRTTMLHRSDFDLDERCIATAVRVLSAAVFRLIHANNT
ncbi:MAG: M20 family metallopeptidase [Pseudomonadota bacterium]